MKIKVFDLEDILYDVKNIDKQKIKKEILPYVCFPEKNNVFGLCHSDNKSKIISILKKYEGIYLEGNFIDPKEYFSDDDIDWDFVYIGEFEIDGNEVWKEFGFLLEESEEIILKSDNIENEWYDLQRKALRNVLDRYIYQRRKELDRSIELAEKDYKIHKGIFR